jgi:c-di-GMP-related signal transduction protein
MGTNIFLSRQPIVDRGGRTIAYELLYRQSAHAPQALLEDDAWATSRVVRRAFGQLGVNTVLGPCRGFVNVDAEFLFAPAVERLPSNCVVLEILETVAIDASLVRRCAQLRQRGFRFALDDVCALREDHLALMDFVDIVKIDLPAVADESLADLIERLRPYRALLLAEKVSTREQATRCLQLGFALFQGFFFARPCPVL